MKKIACFLFLVFAVIGECAWIGLLSSRSFSLDSFQWALRVDNASNFSYDGSFLLSQWSDLSGGSRHGTQSTDVKKPLYVASCTPSGAPCIRGDGNNSVLDFGNHAYIKTNAPWTMFLVFKVRNFLTETVPYLGHFTTNTTTTYGIIPTKIAGRINFGGTGFAQLSTEAHAFDFSKWNVVTLSFDGADHAATSSYSLFNGSTVVPVDGTGGAGGWNQGNSYFAMNRYLDGVYYQSAEFDVAAILISDGSLTDTSRSLIISHLKRTYGVE